MFIYRNNDVKVKVGTHTWRFNPKAVTKINTIEDEQQRPLPHEVRSVKTEKTVAAIPNGGAFAASAAITKQQQPQKQQQAQQTQQFALNDLVEVCADIERMKELQKDHGGWAESMRLVSSFSFFFLIFIL